MKLIRFGDPGKEHPGLLLNDGTRVDLSEFSPNGFDYDEAFFFERWHNPAARMGRRSPVLGAACATVRALGPPIARPSKIVCIGLNFRDHAAESKMEIPKEPVIFFKSTTSLVGPNDSLVMPRGATKVDWEVELALVMSRKALYVSRENALEFVNLAQRLFRTQLSA